MERTRSSLLRRIGDLNDAAGWDEFDKLYRPLLIGYARQRGLRAEEAEEIAQECLTALVARKKSFEGVDSFRGWLRGMVAHKVSDLFRQRGRHQRADTAMLAETPDDQDTPDELWQRQWNQTHLEYCIASLRAEFAPHTLQAFAMYVLLEKPVREIAQHLGMTPNQIYVGKTRIMARIRERFGEVIDGLYGKTP